MKLLLKEDVPSLGYCGDEVEVKDGYGRNFLVPQGKALMATPENVKAFRHQKSVVQAKVRKLKHAAEEVAKQITDETCEFTKKVGDQGKLFGSVTSQEIADFLNKKGYDLDRRKIQMADPIKTLGEHTVQYKIHPEVTVDIKIKVLKEEMEETSTETPTPAGEADTPATEETSQEPAKDDGGSGS